MLVSVVLKHTTQKEKKNIIYGLITDALDAIISTWNSEFDIEFIQKVEVVDVQSSLHLFFCAHLSDVYGE